MNYQMFLECHAAGTVITKNEAHILDLERESQIASIKVSKTEGCIEVAPDKICKAARVCNGSFWITCLAAVLDQIVPIAIGAKARGARVFDELVGNGYLVAD